VSKKPRTTPEEIEHHRARAREYYHRNKAKAKACTEASRIKRTYGLTLDQLESLKEAQGNCCALCRKESKLVIDHCHVTGEVRGLLCHHCNTGLGALGDSIGGLQRAIIYLTNRPTF
jgi:hypothetical protein